VLGPARAVPNRGEARFDRVSGPDRHPVFGREVVKGQQGHPIPDQLFHRLGILGAEVANEAVERFFGLDLP
jgi:hypothetical protein